MNVKHSFIVHKHVSLWVRPFSRKPLATYVFCAAFLVADDPELQITACSAGALKLLIEVLHKVHEAALPQWQDVEFEHISRLREVRARFICSYGLGGQMVL